MMWIRLCVILARDAWTYVARAAAFASLDAKW